VCRNRLRTIGADPSAVTRLPRRASVVVVEERQAGGRAGVRRRCSCDPREDHRHGQDSPQSGTPSRLTIRRRLTCSLAITGRCTPNPVVTVNHARACDPDVSWPTGPAMAGRGRAGCGCAPRCRTPGRTVLPGRCGRPSLVHQVGAAARSPHACRVRLDRGFGVRAAVLAHSPVSLTPGPRTCAAARNGSGGRFSGGSCPARVLTADVRREGFTISRRNRCLSCNEGTGTLLAGLPGLTRLVFPVACPGQRTVLLHGGSDKTGQTGSSCSS